jgi:hypothetical protein
MEKGKSTIIQMIYGYAICLVAVITFLIAITSLVQAVMDLTDPIHAYRSYGRDLPNLSSFENYKLGVMKSTDTEQFSHFDDETLKLMYNADKADALAKVRHNSNKTILVDSLLLVITIILFAAHWIWLSKLRKKSA